MFIITCQELLKFHPDENPIFLLMIFLSIRIYGLQATKSGDSNPEIILNELWNKLELYYPVNLEGIYDTSYASYIDLSTGNNCRCLFEFK